MADENEDIDDVEIEEDVQLDEQDNIQENKVEKRIKTLSNKVKQTAQERDNETKARQKAEKERDALKLESEFSSSFSESPHYSVAKDYKDEIRKKVSSGYVLEDAIVSTLAKEGKLDSIKKFENPAGGSATNLPSTGNQKSLKDMSREEKRVEVLKAMDKGDISLS